MTDPYFMLAALAAFCTGVVVFQLARWFERRQTRARAERRRELLRAKDDYVVFGRDTGGTSQRRGPHGDPWKTPMARLDKED